MLAAAAMLAAAVAGIAAAQDEVKVERVHFGADETSATVHDSIRGYQSADYRLTAKAGQTMRVAIKSDNPSNYFNVIAPGADEAMFIGATSGEEFSGTLPEDGRYTVRVYLTRNEARRGAVARYDISFAITGP